jgi:hypothetical protein
LQRVRATAQQREWGRGWDTHPGLFAILACFQQDAENRHKHWRFNTFNGFRCFNCGK